MFSTLLFALYTGFKSGGLCWGSVHPADRCGGRAERILLVRQGGRQGGPASLGEDARGVDRLVVQLEYTWFEMLYSKIRMCCRGLLI